MCSDVLCQPTGRWLRKLIGPHPTACVFRRSLAGLCKTASKLRECSETQNALARADRAMPRAFAPEQCCSSCGARFLPDSSSFRCFRVMESHRSEVTWNRFQPDANHHRAFEAVSFSKPL